MKVKIFKSSLHYMDVNNLNDEDVKTFLKKLQDAGFVVEKEYNQVSPNSITLEPYYTFEIDIETLDDMIKLRDLFGSNLIFGNDEKLGWFVEIYDDWRE